jgi:hypothetical protein
MNRGFRRVYYFTKVVFHPRGHGFNELVCIRMAEDNPQIGAYTDKWQTRGRIFYTDYPFHTLEDEKRYLSFKMSYERIRKITIVDPPKEEPKEELK